MIGYYFFSYSKIEIFIGLYMRHASPATRLFPSLLGLLRGLQHSNLLQVAS